MRIAEDRVAEKCFLVENGFPVGRYQVLEGDDPVVDESLVESGAIVKTARLGYDGKGQRSVSGVAETLAVWAELGGVACVVEQRLALETELSVIVGRTPSGDVEAWPVAENRHVDGILDVSAVPATVSAKVADRAVGLTMAIADALAYVGVLAVEMFVVDGVLVNVLAPRTTAATRPSTPASPASTSSRCAWGAVWRWARRRGRPPPSDGEPAGRSWSVGAGMGGCARGPEPELHLYGKHEARPGRKMGHVTVTAPAINLAVARALELRAAVVR